MKKDEIFFGESGLTSTSANFVSNLAKESYRALQKELDSIVFYTTTLTLLGSDKSSTLREGVRSVGDIKEKLHDVARLKSLIAWLREALKAKDRLIEEAKSSTYSDYGIELPERPIEEDYITADDVIGSWGIKQRNRYYYLDTLCATIGTYIHPDGVYATERDALQKVLHEPNTLSGSGRDAIIKSCVPSILVQEVEGTFMDLQAVYRGYQAELNSMKHEVEVAVNNDITEKSTVYHKAMEDYRNKMLEIDAHLSLRKKQAVTAAQSLKIVIPDSLKDIYAKVNSLGKK